MENLLLFTKAEEFIIFTEPQGGIKVKLTSSFPLTLASSLSWSPECQCKQVYCKATRSNPCCLSALQTGLWLLAVHRSLQQLSLCRNKPQTRRQLNLQQQQYSLSWVQGPSIPKVQPFSRQRHGCFVMLLTLQACQYYTN